MNGITVFCGSSSGDKEVMFKYPVIRARINSMDTAEMIKIK